MAETPGPVVQADFTSTYNAISGTERDPITGRFPVRRETDLLPLAEYVRRAIISGAAEMDITVVATNSDGDRRRRRRVLALHGPGATERVIDPGRAEVTRRLRDQITGTLGEQCSGAIQRWYSRKGN